MNLSTQLRIILLLAGVAIWFGIYWFGKRRAAPRNLVDVADDELPSREVAVFAESEEIDEEALDTPAYMRRQGQRDVRQDYEPRIANVGDYDGIDAVHDDGRQFVDIAVHNSRRESVPAYEDAQSQPVTSAAHADPVYVDAPLANTQSATTIQHDEPTFTTRHEPRVSFDDEFAVSAAEPQVSASALPEFAVTAEPVIAAHESEPQAVPVVAEPVVTSYQAPVRTANHESVPTPMLSEEVARKSAPVVEAAVTPAPKPAETQKSSGNATARRKIIALRLPMAERVAGDQLLPLLQREQLQHGKFSIFHRLHETQAVFSVASMVEPGTFDPATMQTQQFPGVTLFMQLPGPLDGLIAYDQMMSCAQRLAHATGGVLQDERGSKLTAQTMERLREGVLDFQHLIGSTASL
jgi:cell division protein ZipA